MENKKFDVNMRVSSSILRLTSRSTTSNKCTSFIEGATTNFDGFAITR